MERIAETAEAMAERCQALAEDIRQDAKRGGPALVAASAACGVSLIACAAFGEDFVSLLKPGAPCERRSIDAVLVRYNQLKAARAANGGAAATTA